ncbi:MAG: CPBP family intramembrane metalloprotease [Myxococcota bacterium]|nr:CPBP family intramembrane metalloprotease [Myxococcota bacterium]
MESSHKVGLFVGISYGLAVAMAGALAISDVGYGGLLGSVFAVLYMFTPMLAVIAVQLLAGEKPFHGLSARPRLNRWLLAGSLGTLVLVFAAMLAGFALPGLSYDPSIDAILDRFGDMLSPEQLAETRQELEALPVHPAFLSIPQILIAGATLNALFAFGEEIGWRGLLYRELSHLGFWKTSLITGIIWGFWHAPIILVGHNYPEHPLPGAFLFVVICVLLSPLHTFIRQHSGTVWGAAICHGTFNAAAGLPLLVTAGGSDLEVGVTGLAGVIGMAVANLALAAWMAFSGRAARSTP